MFGELVPVGGGDTIPLLKRKLLVGRRESCDIVLRFSNVSAHHCELNVLGGYWYVRDLGSRNGIKVNGVRVTDKRVDPGDTVSVAKHSYKVEYSPIELGAVGPPPPDFADGDIFKKSLLERAGLQKDRVPQTRTPSDPDEPRRYDVTSDDPQQPRSRYLR
ncbi:MAG: FHA domain-containing protein [Planctomycetota bacterium]